MNYTIKGIVTAGLILGLQSAYAATLTIPNSFTANSPTVAADVNANFTAAATAVNDIEARLAALEAVTSTNMAVNPLQKAAGTWAFVNDVTWGGQFVPNLVDIGREVIYGTMVVNSTGSFTMNDVGGHGIDFGLNNNLVLQPVILPKADGTTNLVNTAKVVDQKAIVVNSTVPAGAGTGTISVGPGNVLTIQGASPGAPVMTGYISQNGQVMMIQGTPTSGSTTAAESRILTFIKIQ